MIGYSFAEPWWQLEQHFQRRRVLSESQQHPDELQQQPRLSLRSTLICQKVLAYGLASSTERIKEPIALPVRVKT